MYSSKISLKSEKMKNNINFTMSPEPRFLQLRNRKCFFSLSGKHSILARAKNKFKPAHQYNSF